MPNKYDYLRLDRVDESSPVEATASWTLTNDRHETVTITTAVLPDGAWVYGYNVLWARGGNSFRHPSADSGVFRTQREAYLHAIGFMRVYSKYFLPATQNALVAAELKIIQPELF